MVPVFQSYGQTLIDFWQNEIDNCGGKQAALEVHKDLSRLTLDVICKCAFDFECNAISDENNPISTSFCKILGGLTLR